MRNKINWLLPIMMLACCCFSTTGCKSMKGNFSKLAFWKKDTPPVSQLAQRSVAPPSRSASVLDGTTEKRTTQSGTLGQPGSMGQPGASGIDRYAQTQTNQTANAGPSAFGRTKPYSFSPSAGAGDSIGPGSIAGKSSGSATSPSSGFANDTRFGGALANRSETQRSETQRSESSSGGFGASRPSAQTPPSQSLASNPKAIGNPYAMQPGSGSANAGSNGSGSNGAGTSTGGIPSYRSSTGLSTSAPSSPGSQFNPSGSFASNANSSTSLAKSSTPPGEYPSTKFGTYSPSASQAGLTSDPANSNFGQISQASSTVSANQSNGPRKGSLPEMPAIALSRNGSYAPGSTGSAASGAYPAGFTPSSGAIARQKAACSDGCSCSSCNSESTANAAETRGGGSFNFR